jgi:siroheme synthase (precorrin-2 oxidase/ferrochelatase)
MVAYGVRRKIILESNDSALSHSMDVNTTSYNTILSTSTNGLEEDKETIRLRVHRDLWDANAYVYVLVATDDGTLYHMKAQREKSDKEVIYTTKKLQWTIGDGFTPIYVLFTSQALEGITAVSDVDDQSKDFTEVSGDLKTQIQSALKELQLRAKIDERRRFLTRLMSKEDMEHYLDVNEEELRELMSDQLQELTTPQDDYQSNWAKQALSSLW